MAWIIWLLLLLPGQDPGPPPYLREGNRIEQQFKDYRDRLDRFFIALRSTIARTAPDLLPTLQPAPPAAGIWGYQLLPKIVEQYAGQTRDPVSSFSYSWPATEGYIQSELTKLVRDEEQMKGSPPAAAISSLIEDYRNAIQNQRTVEQYIQYNRFWQDNIASNRVRFDQATVLYNQVEAGTSEANAAIRETLGVPAVPAFLRVVRTAEGHVTLQVPVYTDIEDPEFLRQARTAIEDMWNVRDGTMVYSIAVEFRAVSPDALYTSGSAPARAQHIDLEAHIARFPGDGGILTTGTSSLHSVAGRYIALSPGDISKRTLAHEFGHLLGFRDGYIRGYRDLGERGFEILERTSAFDDIMSAPREGSVKAEHFRLLLDALDRRP